MNLPKPFKIKENFYDDFFKNQTKKKESASSIAILNKPETTTKANGISPGKSEDRLFLEGFYDVDGATTDYEREERKNQVESALWDIQKRETKKLTHKTNGSTQTRPLKYQNASSEDTVTITMTDGTKKTMTQSEFKAMVEEAGNYSHTKDMLRNIAQGKPFTVPNTNKNTSAKTETKPPEKPETLSRDERDAHVRENYAARGREIDYTDREAMKKELADIEAAENQDFESEWYKRLERGHHL